MRIPFTITLLLLALILGGLAVVHMGDKYREKIFGAPAIATGEKLFDFVPNLFHEIELLLVLGHRSRVVRIGLDLE